MDKVVILFKGGVETQEYFSIEMSKTFQKHGYEIYWFDLVLSGLSAKQLCDFYKADKSKKFMAFLMSPSSMSAMSRLNPWRTTTRITT